jgi:hypothetical protein
MVPETKNVLARASSDLLEPKRAKDVAPTQKYQPLPHVEEEAPISLEQIKIWSLVQKGTETKNDRAGEDQKQITRSDQTESHGSCLKPLLLTIVTSLLSHCPYQKDGRAKPGNIKKIIHFPQPE